MAPLYKTGQRVRYKTVTGTDSNTFETTGTITDVLTEANVQDSPRYEIVDDVTGKTTTVDEADIFGEA